MPAPILLTEPATPDVRMQNFAAYRAVGGYSTWERARSGQPEAVLAAVEASGLLGHGGAAFPAGRKWRLAAQAESASGERYVVANGGEHEPGSEKDKFLVARYPHKVLEGLLLAGFATGAKVGYVYLIEDMDVQIEAVELAIDELHSADLLDGFDLRVHRAPTTYVAGEETAALDSIEGGPGRPRKKPPYPGEAGLFGAPTTVNNVETLAHVPFLVEHGADAYRALGTQDSPGTMLVTLGERAKTPGIYEIEYGKVTLRQVIDELGGGTASGKAVRAVLPALSSSWVPAESLDVSMSHEALRELGSGLGCGGISWVEEGEDPVARTLEIAQFFMAEQCGQCAPCRMETNQFVHVLKGVQDARGPGYAQKIDKLATFARGKGHCSLIEMAAAPVRSAVTVFADEFAAAAGPAPAED